MIITYRVPDEYKDYEVMFDLAIKEFSEQPSLKNLPKDVYLNVEIKETK